MTTQTEALKLALEALDQLTNAADTFSVSGVYFNEGVWAKKCLSDAYFAITAIEQALAQPEQDKERCVGCEACIDTACGRDECPKGWPKAAQPEQEPVAYCDIHHLPEPCVQCAKEHEGYNIPPQPKETEQEPVEWVARNKDIQEICELLVKHGAMVGKANAGPYLIWLIQSLNLNCEATQRKPLTDEEIERLRIEQEFDQWAISEGAFKYAARAIEAAHGIKGD